MLIEKIENYLNSENGKDLDKILEEVKVDIEKIEYYAETIFKKYMVSNPEEAKKALSILTGIYMKLNPIADLSYHKAESIEVKSRNKHRINITKEQDGKFKTTDVEQGKIISREAPLIYKRIANIINGYREDCKTAITSLQSMLKSEKREYNSQGD